MFKKANELTQYLLDVNPLEEIIYVAAKIYIINLPFEYDYSPPVFSIGSIILNTFYSVSLRENDNPAPLKNSSTKFHVKISPVVGKMVTESVLVLHFE